MEDLPPRSFRYRVLRCRNPPRSFGLVGIGSRHRRPMVIGADHTSCQEKAPEHGNGELQSPHDGGPAEFDGATFTVSPSSMESAGLMMIRSAGPTPPRISRVVP